MWGGYYSRSNMEFLLLGTRGQCASLREVKNVSQLLDPEGYVSQMNGDCHELFDDQGRFRIIEASPHLGHSVKPNGAREAILKVFGDMPRIELFCRILPETDPKEDPRLAGWDVWGNQIPPLAERPALDFSYGSMMLRRVEQIEWAQHKQTPNWQCNLPTEGSLSQKNQKKRNHE